MNGRNGGRGRQGGWYESLTADERTEMRARHRALPHRLGNSGSKGEQSRRRRGHACLCWCCSPWMRDRAAKRAEEQRENAEMRRACEDAIERLECGEQLEEW